MTRRSDLLSRAALCFERAELHADAARCYQDAGRLVSAGQAYVSAGNLTRAADCFRAGNEQDAAASLYAELGQPAAAADCWESVGDLLSAGWVLATQTREIHRAMRLLGEATAKETGRRLRRDLGVGVCRAKGDRRSELLERAITACENELARVPREAERQQVEEWAVLASSLVHREDLAARVLAASYRCGTRGAAERWRRWGAANLGGTFGIPEADSVRPG
jgi:tetratricopeptide (TPR) repeat protein